MAAFEVNSDITRKTGLRSPFKNCTVMRLCIGCHTERAVGGVVVVVVDDVEASAPKVCPRVTLASASTLSGSVVRTLRGGEGLPKVFCLVASSLGHLRSQCSIACGSSL